MVVLPRSARGYKAELLALEHLRDQYKKREAPERGVLEKTQRVQCTTAVVRNMGVDFEQLKGPLRPLKIEDDEDVIQKQIQQRQAQVEH